MLSSPGVGNSVLFESGTDWATPRGTRVGNLGLVSLECSRLISFAAGSLPRIGG